MPTIQTNSALPQGLNFPKLPQNLDPALRQYIIGLQKTISSLYVALVKAVEQRAIVATIAQQPPAGSAGRSFYASDTKALYLDDGHSWNVV